MGKALAIFLVRTAKYFFETGSDRTEEKGSDRTEDIDDYTTDKRRLKAQFYVVRQRSAIIAPPKNFGFSQNAMRLFPADVADDKLINGQLLRPQAGCAPVINDAHKFLCAQPFSAGIFLMFNINKRDEGPKSSNARSHKHEKGNPISDSFETVYKICAQFPKYIEHVHKPPLQRSMNHLSSEVSTTPTMLTPFRIVPADLRDRFVAIRRIARVISLSNRKLGIGDRGEDSAGDGVGGGQRGVSGSSRAFGCRAGIQR